MKRLHLFKLGIPTTNNMFRCLGGGVHPQVAIGTHIHGREEKPDSAKAIVKPPTHWAGGKLSVLNWL